MMRLMKEFLEEKCVIMTGGSLCFYRQDYSVSTQTRKQFEVEALGIVCLKAVSPCLSLCSV
jgi:hypothetical protein